MPTSYQPRKWPVDALLKVKHKLKNDVYRNNLKFFDKNYQREEKREEKKYKITILYGVSEFFRSFLLTFHPSKLRIKMYCNKDVVILLAIQIIYKVWSHDWRYVNDRHRSLGSVLLHELLLSLYVPSTNHLEQPCMDI